MSTSSAYHQAVRQARQLIEAHLDQPLTLEQLAERVGLSPFHFHRIFRGLTGETVAASTRRLLLERAGTRLRQGSEDILGLALEAGYGSHEAFTRAFARHFGVAPSAFRQERHAVLVRGFCEEFTMDIRIEDTQACTIASVRHVGPYNEVGSAWQQLMKWGWSKMIFGRPQTFGLCHDDPEVTASEQLRYDACMVVKEGTRVKDPVELRELPPATYAVVEHAGSYETIGDTYAQLCGQLAAEPVHGSTWRLANPPAREVYLNDPRKTPPDQLRTEIWLPVERA